MQGGAALWSLAVQIIISILVVFYWRGTWVMCVVLASAAAEDAAEDARRRGFAAAAAAGSTSSLTSCCECALPLLPACLPTGWAAADASLDFRRAVSELWPPPVDGDGCWLSL